MLSFLKNKKDAMADASASSPVIQRKPDVEPEYDALESAAQELIDAVQASDVQGVVSALRAAFELCDSEPHVEGPHLESEE